MSKDGQKVKSKKLLVAYFTIEKSRLPLESLPSFRYDVN